MSAWLAACATSAPDAPFLLAPDGGATLRRGEVARRTLEVGRAIAGRGIDRGESVAYATGNGVEAALAVLGVLAGGFRAVAINLVAGEEAIAYALAHSGSRLVLVDAASRPAIEAARRSATFEAFADARSSPPVLVDVADIEALRVPSGPSSVAPPDVTPPGVLPSGEPRTRTDVTGAVGAAGGADVRERGAADGADEEEALSRGVPDGASTDGGATSGIHPDDDALIMYTSGTTGRPKGVVLSHANLVAGGENVARGHALGAADRALCVLPLYHINGLCVTLLGPLVSGGSVLLPPRFSSTRFWHWCREHACTWFSVVPTQVSYLLHADGDMPPVPSLRFGRSASAPLAPDVHRGFESRFGVPLIETMGLTETAAQILSNPMPPGERRSGSPGRAVGCEVRVAGEDLAERAVGVEGEILVRGANVMRRYHRDEAASAAALTPEGWLRTGDLGRRDADGWLYVTGRLKELIIKGGENIAPREIDEALHAHPDVLEAAAFGRPCADYGERVEAAVALAPGASVDEATLLALCVERLGRFKCPDRIHRLEVLPKGPSGKIQRRRVAALCTDPGSGDG